MHSRVSWYSWLKRLHNDFLFVNSSTGFVRMFDFTAPMDYNPDSEEKYLENIL